MPCGAGKTLATADMTQRAATKGNRTVFMVHRKELIEQTSKTFSALGIEHGIISSQFKPNYELPVQIASVQTLINRLDKVAPPNFLIVDECHHIEADTYKQIVRQWKCPLLGLTATPIRMGGKTLHDSFDELVEGPSIKQLIDDKYLANYEYLASECVDLGGLVERAGEYTNKSMSRTCDRMEVIGDVVQSYIDHAFGRKAICYCVNIDHSMHLADSFNARNVRAAHIDCNISALERADIIERFRCGDIDVLCNVELFGEGFDVPDMECVILARPTKSLTLFIQQAMRPLRLDPSNPDKKALILDHAKHYERFDDLSVIRHWTLDPNPPKEPGECPGPGGVRKLRQRVGKMLKVFDSTDTLKKIVEHFKAVERMRGYKKGWAAFQALEYANSLEDCQEIASACQYKKGWGFYKWRDILSKRQAHH